MWENRCKVAVSGVGFSKITRSAEVPLAAHAVQAVQAAVEDSGLAMADIDGLATYAELPASGHAIVDGISIVSVHQVSECRRIIEVDPGQSSTRHGSQ